LNRDINESLLLEEVQLMLRLDMIPEEFKERIKYAEISATRGDGLDTVIDWIEG
jgi:hypothetical protein